MIPVLVTIVDSAGNQQFTVGAESVAEAALQFGAAFVVPGGSPGPNYRWKGNRWKDPLPALLQANQMEALRVERDSRLRASDVLLLRAIESDADKTAIKAYRKALRDLPDTVNLDTLIWPTPP